MLEAFIKFARQIDSKVIAEGIETLEELETLINLGVDYGQGFIIAKPQEDFPREFPLTNYIIQKRRKKRQRLRLKI